MKRAVDAADLLSLSDAMTYLNDCLTQAGGATLSEREFRDRIWRDIEPVESGHLLLFSRDALFRLVVHLAVGRRVAQRIPAPDTAHLYLTGEAIDYLDRQLAARGVRYEMNRHSLHHYRTSGLVRGHTVAQATLYTRQELDRLVDHIAAAGGWKRSKRGRPRRRKAGHG